MVHGFRKENLVAELTSGKHTLISGVPEKSGGHDEGPGPHELLEAALTACTILTLQMYANHKQWPLESAIVDVNITLETTALTQISRKIKLTGNLTPDQEAKLLEVANKCPIHKILHSKIEVSTELVV